MKNSLEETLLKIDNLPGILEYQFQDGMSVWLAIRFKLRFRYLESHANKDNKSLNSQNKSSRGRIHFIKYILQSFFRKPRVGGYSTDILAISNYEDNPQIPNRMTTAYVKSADFKTIEWIYSPLFIQFPKILNTWSFDYFLFRALISNKITGIFKKYETNRAIKDLFDVIINHLKEIVSDKDIDEIKTELFRIDQICVSYGRCLKKSLEKLNPRMVICSEGNNGDWRHHILFKVCHDLKIPSAEVQHGTFNEGMRYGEDIAKSTLLQGHKSQFIFTFGEYHRTQTNLPSKCIPLGHYPLEMELDKIAKLTPNDNGKLKILFVCEGIPPSSKDNAFINTTIAALGKCSVPFELIVRLHHSESRDEKYNGFFEFEGTRYSDFASEGIYTLIAQADVIILHASTVAFESVYFGKQPLVFQDEFTAGYVPEDIGLRFKNTTELLELLNQAKPGNTAQVIAKNNYWISGRVIDNFRNFWSKELRYPLNN